VSVDDVLHLSARPTGVVMHRQNEVTAESITLAAALFNFYVLKMEVTVLNLKTVLLLLY